MAILKRQGRCNNCGHKMPAGTEISWKDVTVNHRHGGNGTITKVTNHWVPVHATLEQCKLAGVPGASNEKEALEILINEAQDKVNKLKYQAENLFFDDEEMKEVAEMQVNQAEKELEYQKSRLTKFK